MGWRVESIVNRPNVKRLFAISQSANPWSDKWVQQQIVRQKKMCRYSENEKTGWPKS